MSRRWLASHRSLVATATSGTVVAALVATIAVVSGGYTAQRLDLGDSAVWVLNEDRQVVGRANTSVRELNTVVSAGSSRLDIVQQGPTVLVVDRGNSSLDILNPATAELGRSVPLPPADPAVYLADDRVVIAADGDLWSVDAEKLDSFDGTAQPTLSLGAGSVTSMDPEGTFFSFTPTTGNVSRVDADSADTVTSSVRINAGSEDDSYQVTSVNGTWSVLNETSRHLFLPGADVDLSTQIQAGDDPVLQQAAGDGNEVLIAHRGGLLAVPVSGGVVNPVLTDRAGRAAVPLQLDGCSYAAWGDGSTWRSCPAGNGGGESGTVEGIAGDARLEFRVNGTEVILNDARNGTSWAVRQDNARIDNWDDLIDRVHDEHLVEENNDDTPPEFEKTQLSPVAVEDEFGARPGRTAILPVLLNDYDPNGDVVVITELRGLAESEGTVDTVGNNQQVRLSLPAGASGRLSFEYSISDGRGGAASATVAVDVRNDDENSPPTQVRPTHATVQAGGRVTREVLGDWVDPDSDPFFLSAAKAQAPDSASFTPDGALVYSDAGTGGDVKQVALQVSDGQAEGSGTLAVDVRPAGEVPIVTEPFVALATAGVELQVSPLGHVRGGSAAIRLSNVPPKPDVTITPDLAGGEFRFVSNTVGTHYIDYTVTDGHVSAAGIVRVDVKAAPDPSMKPVTVPHTAFVRGQQPTLVDVLATDFDPAGGVLLVSGTPDVPPGSGLRAEVLDQRLIRVTLSRPLEGGTASFSYRVTNGLAEADGVVTVMEIPEPSRKQAPIAAQDSISVRVGDAIDIPVLRNDEHPDQDPLALNPELVSELPAGAGLLFASGDVLRYLAPNKTGNFSAVYRVDAPDGQFATAEVQIAVREADPASNNPPVPKTAVARVIAGQKVDIPITLVGIDPDGDSVQLLGQETNPKKGAVTDVGPDSVEYEAGAYSSGTDTFTYTVVDALGARAIGVVRVGISARQDGARNPVAVADEVTARPGSSVAVRVLANDSDPDGGTLKLTGVEASVPGTGAAGIDGDIITVTTPSSEGRFGFIYEVRNERGGTSSNFLTVIVEENAPLSRPDARDTVLALSDVLDRSTIDVDVLANVFFADGPVRELGLRLMPGYSGSAVVTASHRIRVTLGDHKQIVPFRVAHPDDPAVSSYAFIWVPGYEDALPQLRRGAPRLSVPSESTLTIDINKFVVAVGGRNVRLTDASTVRATNSDGAPTAADSDTLVFTSADRYYGPASISFEVTDGSSADNRTGRTATIVLPITVTPRENQPPALENAAIDFEPDQVKVLDLVRLTTYPYPDDQRELEYSVLEPRPSGFTWSLDGSSLTVQADETTPKGTVDSLTIGVRDGVNEGRAGRIEMRVVASTRPIAIPSPDNVTAARGQTTLVDVLANDGAANPFPAVPLRVVSVRGVEAQALPAGITISPSSDNRTLAIRVAAGAAPIDSNVQYQVADATGDPDRFTWGSVRISVQDKPDPITNLRVTGFGDRSVSFSFNAGASNNSPISGYDIALHNPATGALLGTVMCLGTTCEVPTPGNGQDNQVLVSVAGRNGIGLSAPVALADPVWSDVVPAAPSSVAAAPLDGGLRLSWATVAAQGGGTAVRSYAVTVDGSPVGEVGAASPSCGTASCSIDVPGLANGAEVTFDVSARNDAYPALSTWNSTRGTGRPFGPAISGGIAAHGTDSSGAVTVAWDPFNGNGDPILGYYVQRLSGTAVPAGAQACTVSAPAPGRVTKPRSGGSVEQQLEVSAGASSAQFSGLDTPNTRYSFVVWGYNRAGCAATAVTTVLMRPAPGALERVDTVMDWRADAWDFHITGATPDFHHYMLRPAGDGGAGVTFSGQGWPRELLGLPFGSAANVEIRGCTQWACGDWADVPAPEPSLSFAVADLAYDAQLGLFSWSNGPRNGEWPTTYGCMRVEDPQAVSSGGDNTCAVPGERPVSGTARLIVTVNGHSYSYDRPPPEPKGTTP